MRGGGGVEGGVGGWPSLARAGQRGWCEGGLGAVVWTLGAGAGTLPLEEVVGGAARGADAGVSLPGEIMRVAMSGKMVWGSGILGRRGRMGADKLGHCG